ncbi:glycoside hydrolase family protein [Draconibacterium sp. IB214405]|uniref:glycoside hydrolase family protein n=1 Tax=Draconibacterium sp. IB214405 TaxID=3097352 RepID=UPI002A0CD7A2|nr:glycoside hydrolase family protein [Draconibacterium sp. IB214405]MDX8338317.1 glycoside hydrolase family protein [Draconibacterium sp. IB214405]
MKSNYMQSGTLLVFISLFLFVFSGCGNKIPKSISVQALAVEAKIDGNILTGPSVINDPDRFVWGGSVLKGVDGKYHMIYNTFECGDSLPAFGNGWVLGSKLAYAVSDYPDHGFVFKKIVLRGRALEGDSTAWDAQMVSNPHLKKFNGKYYLYFIGSKDPGVQSVGSPGEKLNKRNRVQQNQKIAVIEFDSFEDLMEGNFSRPDAPILSPRTRVKPDNIVNPSPEGTQPKPDNIIVVNPSVTYRPSDGKYLLYFKGNLYDPGWRGVHGVALSDSPTGPFTPLDDLIFDFRTEEGKLASAEDPYVWYHKTQKKFYAVFKDFSGKITGAEPGLAILESIDGIKWTKPADPFFMKKQVVLQSGDTIKVNRLERPQLLINEDGDPEVLYAACSIININPTRKGESFNVQIPLRNN